MSNQGTVTYNGTSTVLTDDPSVGGTSDPTVTQINRFPTTAMVTSGLNPSKEGQSVTFTATVAFDTSQTSPTPPNGTNPTGTFTFKDGSTTISGCASQPITSGQATCTTSALTSAGSPHTVNAVYNGDGNFGTSQNSVQQTVLAPPDLTLTKTHSGNFTQGLTGTYTLTVHNSGSGPTDGTSAIAVTDTLPTGETVNSISGTGWTCTTTPTLGCTRTDPSVTLAAGQDYPVITLTVNVAANAPTSATNQATVSGGGEVNTGNDSASDPTTIDSGAHLTIAKTADAATVSDGTTIGYTITVTNTGTGVAAASALSDPLPGGTGVSWSVSPAYTGQGTCSITGTAPHQTLGCTFGDVNPDAANTVHVTSATSYSSCGQYANTATTSATNNPSVSASATITVQCPALSVTKTADSATVSAGTNIGYTIMVSNSGSAGTATATAVTLSDSLPGGSGVSWSISPTYGGPGTCSITGTAPSQTLTCSFGDLAAGASASVHVTSSTAFASCGSYSNSATASATNQPDVQSIAAGIGVQCPSLSISKTADAATVNDGSSIGFTITVSNSNAAGTGTATGAALSDPLPGGTGVSWTISPAYASPNPGTCAITGTAPSQTLSCSFGDMAKGATATVHVQSSTAYASCGQYSNTATASASNQAPIQASATITVECASLSITKTADNANVVEGNPIGFTIAVSNASAAGTGTALAAALSDPLPGGGGVSWSISPAYSGPGTCSITGTAPSQTLNCSFGDLAKGASASIHITSATDSTSCGNYANTATLSSTNTPSLTGSDSVFVQCGHITVSKKADAATVSAGSAMGYTITVGNTGPQDATNGQITDALPGGTGVSWSISPTYSGQGSCGITGNTPSQTLSCSFGTVALGASITVHITSTTAFASCGQYANTVTATSDNSPQAQSSDTITVECPSLSVTKTADAATVSAGTDIGYTITVSNSGAAGTGTATAATLSDPLPGGTGVSWSISPPYGGAGTCAITGTPPSQTLGCDFGDMAKGASNAVHITSHTTSGSCATYANTATAAAGNHPSVTGQDSTTVECPALAVTKTADNATVSAGDQIGYTVTASNSAAQGTGTATSVSLNDPLPGGTGVSWSISPAYSGQGTCSITGTAPSQTLTCTLGSMAPGDSASVHLISSTGARSCGDYANMATLSATNATASVTGSATTTVQCPSLSLAKSADSGTVNAGDGVGYVITASNRSAAGTGTASTVSLSDPLPGGTGVSWSIAGQPNGNPCSLGGSAGSQTLTCDFGSMAPGASDTVHVTGTTNGATCGSLQNTATLSAGNIPASLTQSASITIQCPSLSIQKSADAATVSAGDTIGYTITASNSSTSGTGSARGVSLNDPLPAGSGVAWSIASQPDGTPCSISGQVGSQVLACTLGSLASGDHPSVHVTSPTTAASCASYSNTATLSASNVPASLTDAATITVNCPQLGLSKTADHATVSAGNPIGFTLKLTNSGLGIARGAAISDPLPGGTDITWSMSPTVNGCAITGGTLACTVGDLAPNASFTVHVTSPTTDNSCAAYRNTATAAATNATGSVTDSASITVACVTQTLYTGTQAVLVGGTVTLSATVTGASVCTSAGSVSFSLDRSPRSSGPDPFPVMAAVTNGTASATGLSTIGWTAGVYTLHAQYSGPAYCQESSDSAILTVGAAGTSAGTAIGGGRYRAPNTSTLYTLVFSKTRTSGQIRLTNAASWSLIGSLATLVKVPGNYGAASGMGTLSYGSTTVKNVPFTISFHANTAPFTFGIHIQYVPATGQPALPNAPPVKLTSGTIQLR